jgi:hypothetical protein
MTPGTFFDHFLDSGEFFLNFAGDLFVLPLGFEAGVICFMAYLFLDCAFEFVCGAREYLSCCLSSLYSFVYLKYPLKSKHFEVRPKTEASAPARSWNSTAWKLDFGRAALGQDRKVCAIGGIAVDQQAEPAVLPLFSRFPFCVGSRLRVI